MLVILSEDALKQYKHLSKKDQLKIRKKLIVLQNDQAAGKKLSGELNGIRSYPAWPYRILYEINKAKKRVEVLIISHRQGVYR